MVPLRLEAGEEKVYQLWIFVGDQLKSFQVWGLLVRKY